MADIVDALDLGRGRQLSIEAGDDGLAAVPAVRDDSGTWRRARPGDGVAEALLELLAREHDSATLGRFTVRSWTRESASGERAVGVDQTNESVIVGDTAVVKWATHLAEGPHPAPHRIAALRDAGFTGMPAPWGLLTWHASDAAETLVAYVDEYLPGAVDGWTWAVDAITDAATHGDPGLVTPAVAAVGSLIAELHAALSATCSLASVADVDRWRDEAITTFETACSVGDSASSELLRSRGAEVTAELEVLGALAGVAVIEGHGDLHVGQILRSEGRFAVTDFDGNPVLPAAQRVLPIPAVLDVAGMAQSLAHVSVVARKYTVLDAATLASVDRAAQDTFLSAYLGRLTELGHARLFDPRPLRALRLQQVMREIIYAARHLPRWMYVPDAALPALLDERTQM